MPCLCGLSHFDEPRLLNYGFPCVDVYNKIDAVSLEQVDKLARQPNTVVISCELDLKSVNIESTSYRGTELDLVSTT